MLVTAHPRHCRGTKIPDGTHVLGLDLGGDLYVKVHKEPASHRYLLYRNGVSTGELYTFDELRNIKEQKELN